MKEFSSVHSFDMGILQFPPGFCNNKIHKWDERRDVGIGRWYEA